MRYGLTCLCLAVLCVLALPAFAVESSGKSFVLWASSTSAESCVTTDCHAVLGRAKHVHVPVAEGDCSVCHSATDQPHPGADSMALVEEEPGLCLQCHENPAEDMAFPHSAVEEGCTGCHSPHQGAFPKFVLQQGGKLCLMCHEDVVAGEFVHGPVRANNCGMCHGVHGGENESMLNLPGKDNCLACHSGIKKIMDNAVSQHEPVVNGVCWDCHTPHSSDYKPFLKMYYPEEFYAPYKEENFALCFGCHDSTAFTYWITSEATNFRNHNSNLHAFHVNRPDKGRVCKTCHGVHGADQMKLINTRSGGFGRWGVPIYFDPTETGGGCLVGCHGPKKYDVFEKYKNN